MEQDLLPHKNKNHNNPHTATEERYRGEAYKTPGPVGNFSHWGFVSAKNLEIYQCVPPRASCDYRLRNTRLQRYQTKLAKTEGAAHRG